MGSKRKYSLLIAILLVSTSFLVHFSTAVQEFYCDYERLIDAFKTLADTHAELASYETIGKTVEGEDIILFKIGNEAGGGILYDGTMHGTESLGGGLLYYYMKWLLESGEPLATRILARDRTLLIPVLNVDGMRRYTRTNANGVDLNRNFATDWEHGSSDPTSEMYRGPNPLSEPESQALIKVLREYRPAFYVNLHMWNGPYYAGSYYAENSNYGSIKSQIDIFSWNQSVTPYYFQGEFLGKGFAIGDAAIEGSTSFLVELGRTLYPAHQIEAEVLQQFLPIAAVLSQECELEYDFTLHTDLNLDGEFDIFDVVEISVAYRSTPGHLGWNEAADVNKDSEVDIFDFLEIKLEF